MKSNQFEVNQDPTLDSQLVPFGFLKTYIANLVGSGPVGPVFITDIQPTVSGNVQKTYVSNTVPTNAVISSVLSDTGNIRVYILAEGGTGSYSPTVTINGVAVILTEPANDKREFTGYADIVMPADGTVTAVSSTGSTCVANVTLAGAGPTVYAVNVGAYPGSQTAVKSGDTMTVTGSVDNSATYAEIMASGAALSLVSLTLGAADSGGSGKKSITGTFTVSGLSGSQAVSVRARNTLGTYGATVQSLPVTLDQTYPTIGTISIAYPATQTALKGTESATVSATVSNYSSISYTSSADLSVASPTAYAASKTVTRNAGTTGYVNGTNNYTITATRAINGAVTIRNAAITIADTAATVAISIDTAPARLVSSAAGQSYTVRLTPSQPMSSVTSLNTSIGTWGGSWVASTGNTWINTLIIRDTDPRGTLTFSGLSEKNLAGQVGSTITAGSTATVGGFVTRTVTFSAFSQIAAIGTSVATIAKTTARYTGASVLTLTANTNNMVLGYTITDSAGNYNPTGDHIFITDAAFAGSNTSGTLQVDIGETA